MDQFEFIPGLINFLPCNSCIKSDICEERKERVTQLALELESKVDDVIFPGYTNLMLRCKHYYPDIAGMCCDKKDVSKGEVFLDTAWDENGNEIPYRGNPWIPEDSVRWIED